MTIETPIIVDPSRKISKVMINRITRDLRSKSEMVLRESGIPNTIIANFSQGRRQRQHFSLDIHSSILELLRGNYTKQIVDSDNTLKQLRDTITSVESQYITCLTNYGLEYNPPSYRDPFQEVISYLNDRQLGERISTQRINSLADIIAEAKTAMENIAFRLDTIIETETLRLNSIDRHRSKRDRVRQLQAFAEKVLLELIVLRDNMKRRITDEIQKYTTESIAKKNHEDHGPVPIL